MTHDPVITEALKPCRICNSPCRIEVFGGGVHCDPAEIWMCSAHKMFGGQCQSDITYLTEQAWQAAMHRANPVDVEGMGWQAIETAPKDGSEFVMLDANVRTPAVGCWMIDVEWRNTGKLAGEALAEPGWFPLATPTHWMPLPAPPEALNSQGGVK